MASSSYLLVRMLVVFLLFCLSKASGGTCLSYGHSCWGGHGKRNGGLHLGPASQKHTAGWYLSKLFDGSEEDSKNINDFFKSQNLDSEEVENFHRGGFQVFPDLHAERNIIREGKKNLESDLKPMKLDSDSDETEEEIMVLSPDVQRLPLSNLRLYQILSQENNKQRSEY